MTEPERPRRRRRREIDAEVSREIARIQQEHPRNQIARPEGRCRVCMDPNAQRRVNLMLSYGMRPQEVVDNIADLNATKPKRNRIGYWSVYDHRKNHFNVQEQTRESYLRILERRAQEEGVTLAEGVGSILTLRGYLEIVANRGFQSLLEADSVGWTSGLDAQRELEEMVKKDTEAAERTAMRRDLALIQQAITEELTEEQMKAISARLDILRGLTTEADDTIEGEVVDDDDEEEDDFMIDDEEEE